MSVLRFLPAIVLTAYITFGNVVAFRPAAMRPLALIGILLMLLWAALRRRSGGFSAIDGGFLLFMAISGMAFWAFPQTLGAFMADFPTGLLYVVLFLIVALPAALTNRYFTVHFAKRTTPKAVWETDIFKSINRHMTWFWAALFAAAALITAIPHLFALPENLLTGLLFQIILPGVLLTAIGIPFNRRYPRYYQRRLGIEPAAFDPVHAGEPAAVWTDSDEKPHKEEKMDGRARVVALNGSPHGAAGNISQMIQMVVPALTEQGIVVEEIQLAGKRIEYCVGCALCLQEGKCWRSDDHAGVVEKLLAADGIILASPVYFGHVTAQMKAFIDRSLTYGHKPRRTWKPGLAVSVSAGRGETATGHYLAGMLGVYGAFSVGTFTAIATNPAAFLGKGLVEARARDLAHDLGRAIREKRRYPATDEHLAMFLFMRELVTREKDFMEDDDRYWRETGLYDGFEAFSGQKFAEAGYDPGVRKAWLREIIREDRAKHEKEKVKGGETEAVKGDEGAAAKGKAAAKTCFDLIQMMPLGFRKEAADGLTAVYQFEITGPEVFAAHIRIADGGCSFHEGRHGKPDVVIRSPADVWFAISRGELNGQTAFMAGKYTIEGDIGLLMKLNALFG